MLQRRDMKLSLHAAYEVRGILPHAVSTANRKINVLRITALLIEGMACCLSRVSERQQYE